MRRVDVVLPDPAWRSQFEAEAGAIAPILQDTLKAIHHIGSTSIPGIYAKPIIDILVEVASLAAVDAQTLGFQALGYTAMGEFGIPGRRYFRKDNSEGIRTHHIHIFESGSKQITRHLDFRDYLTAHPDEAQQYSDLKRKLAQQYSQDIEGYMDGKDGFIQAIDRKAAQWRNAQG
jgi:GrpB-like predicted nucleotidyltransferase (UPF0157 family)